MQEFLQSFLQSLPSTQSIVVKSLVAIGVFWLASVILIRLIVPRIHNERTRYIFRRTIHYTAIILGMVILARLWLTGVQSLLTFFGLIAAGITISLKEPIQNLFAWFTIIIWRELFRLGDRVEVGGYAGDVVDMGIFYFTLMEIGNWVDAEQSTGRILKVPNALVITHAVANYSRGLKHIWNEIPILVSGESDWKKAKAILQDIAETHGERPNHDHRRSFRENTEEFIVTPTLTPTVYTRIAEHGVLLTIRHLCEPKHRRDIEKNISERILEEFDQHPTIQIVYKSY